MATEVAEAEMVHGMVLGTTAVQVLADMPAMVQTLMVVVVVVITHLQAAEVQVAVGTQAHMVYQLAAA